MAKFSENRHISYVINMSCKVFLTKARLTKKISNIFNNQVKSILQDQKVEVIFTISNEFYKTRAHTCHTAKRNECKL